jgi:putative transposase
MVVVVDSVIEPEIKVETSHIAGFDFGLKTFLTVSDGSKIESPQFLKQSLTAIKKASSQHSLKVKGSANRERARKNLVRRHEDVVNRRSDWFWKLAHALTDRFDAFGEFLKILEWVAQKKDKQVIFIDRWYPSSKTCSNCGHVLTELDLSIREWRCPSCESVNGRDENAAKNVCAVGASTAKLGDVRQAKACNCCSILESPRVYAGEYVNFGVSALAAGRLPTF